jgi:hypothetical protein
MKKNEALDVVKTWLSALNNRDHEGVIQASDTNIESVGPRGSGYGHQLLRDWLTHASLSLESLRTFARDNQVVVAQHAVWHSERGEIIGGATVASYFRVKGDCVAQYARYDSLDEALQVAELNDTDEIK